MRKYVNVELTVHEVSGLRLPSEKGKGSYFTSDVPFLSKIAQLAQGGAVELPNPQIEIQVGRHRLTLEPRQLTTGWHLQKSFVFRRVSERCGKRSGEGSASGGGEGWFDSDALAALPFRMVDELLGHEDSASDDSDGSGTDSDDHYDPETESSDDGVGGDTSDSSYSGSEDGKDKGEGGGRREGGRLRRGSMFPTTMVIRIFHNGFLTRDLIGAFLYSVPLLLQGPLYQARVPLLPTQTPPAATVTHSDGSATPSGWLTISAKATSVDRYGKLLPSSVPHRPEEPGPEGPGSSGTISSHGAAAAAPLPLSVLPLDVPSLSLASLHFRLHRADERLAALAPFALAVAHGGARVFLPALRRDRAPVYNLVTPFPTPLPLADTLVEVELWTHIPSPSRPHSPSPLPSFSLGSGPTHGTGPRRLATARVDVCTLSAEGETGLRWMHFYRKFSGVPAKQRGNKSGSDLRYGSKDGSAVQAGKDVMDWFRSISLHLSPPPISQQAADQAPGVFSPSGQRVEESSPAGVNFDIHEPLAYLGKFLYSTAIVVEHSVPTSGSGSGSGSASGLNTLPISPSMTGSALASPDFQALPPEEAPRLDPPTRSFWLNVRIRAISGFSPANVALSPAVEAAIEGSPSKSAGVESSETVEFSAEVGAKMERLRLPRARVISNGPAGAPVSLDERLPEFEVDLPSLDMAPYFQFRFKSGSSETGVSGLTSRILTLPLSSITKEQTAWHTLFSCDPSGRGQGQENQLDSPTERQAAVKVLLTVHLARSVSGKPPQAPTPATDVPAGAPATFRKYAFECFVCQVVNIPSVQAFPDSFVEIEFGGLAFRTHPVTEDAHPEFFESFAGRVSLFSLPESEKYGGVNVSQRSEIMPSPTQTIMENMSVRVWSAGDDPELLASAEIAGAEVVALRSGTFRWFPLVTTVHMTNVTASPQILLSAYLIEEQEEPDRRPLPDIQKSTAYVKESPQYEQHERFEHYGIPRSLASRCQRVEINCRIIGVRIIANSKLTRPYPLIRACVDRAPFEKGEPLSVGAVGEQRERRLPDGEDDDDDYRPWNWSETIVTPAELQECGGRFDCHESFQAQSWISQDVPTIQKLLRFECWQSDKHSDVLCGYAVLHLNDFDLPSAATPERHRAEPSPQIEFCAGESLLRLEEANRCGLLHARQRRSTAPRPADNTVGLTAKGFERQSRASPQDLVTQEEGEKDSLVDRLKNYTAELSSITGDARTVKLLADARILTFDGEETSRSSAADETYTGSGPKGTRGADFLADLDWASLQRQVSGLNGIKSEDSGRPPRDSHEKVPIEEGADHRPLAYSLEHDLCSTPGAICRCGQWPASILSTKDVSKADLPYVSLPIYGRSNLCEKEWLGEVKIVPHIRILDGAEGARNVGPDFGNEYRRLREKISLRVHVYEASGMSPQHPRNKLVSSVDDTRWTVLLRVPGAGAKKQYGGGLFAHSAGCYGTGSSPRFDFSLEAAITFPSASFLYVLVLEHPSDSIAATSSPFATFPQTVADTVFRSLATFFSLDDSSLRSADEPSSQVDTLRGSESFLSAGASQNNGPPKGLADAHVHSMTVIDLENRWHSRRWQAEHHPRAAIETRPLIANAWSGGRAAAVGSLRCRIEMVGEKETILHPFVPLTSQVPSALEVRIAILETDMSIPGIEHENVFLRVTRPDNSFEESDVFYATENTAIAKGVEAIGAGASAGFTAASRALNPLTPLTSLNPLSSQIPHSTPSNTAQPNPAPLGTGGIKKNKILVNWRFVHEGVSGRADQALVYTLQLFAFNVTSSNRLLAETDLIISTAAIESATRRSDADFLTDCQKLAETDFHEEGTEEGNETGIERPGAWPAKESTKDSRDVLGRARAELGYRLLRWEAAATVDGDGKLEVGTASGGRPSERNISPSFVRLNVQLVTERQAKMRPVGRAREEPNRDPHLPFDLSQPGFVASNALAIAGYFQNAVSAASAATWWVQIAAASVFFLWVAVQLRQLFS